MSPPQKNMPKSQTHSVLPPFQELYEYSEVLLWAPERLSKPYGTSVVPVVILEKIKKKNLIASEVDCHEQDGFYVTNKEMKQRG